MLPVTPTPPPRLPSSCHPPFWLGRASNTGWEWYQPTTTWPRSSISCATSTWLSASSSTLVPALGAGQEVQRGGLVNNISARGGVEGAPQTCTERRAQSTGKTPDEASRLRSPDAWPSARRQGYASRISSTRCSALKAPPSRPMISQRLRGG